MKQPKRFLARDMKHAGFLFCGFSPATGSTPGFSSCGFKRGLGSAEEASRRDLHHAGFLELSTLSSEQEPNRERRIQLSPERLLLALDSDASQSSAISAKNTSS